jgi:VWFA-related protein
MTILTHACAVAALILADAFSLIAQQPAAAPSTHALRQEVYVDARTGQPVNDLEQKDFTVSDNKSARPITYFRKLDPQKEQVSVVLLLDAVNTPYSTISYARGGIEKFLKMNQGQLSNPTSMAIMTDQGVEMNDSFSTDGNALSDELEHHTIGLREITRNSEWSGPERLQICINAVHKMIQSMVSLPGRKIVVWISPGWPLVSGPQVYLDAKQEQEIFNEVVTMSAQLRGLDITMYVANPLGTGEPMQEADLYETYLKGVSKVDQVQFGHLSIQVLAAQSGGLVIEGSSDVTGMLQRCLLDANSWYEIGFDPLPADKANEYHHIEIKVDRPGVVVRTRDGYYANPVAAPVR